MRPHRPFRPLFRALACLSLLAPALASAPALARPPQSGAPPSQAEAATLDAARKIAEEGLTLYDSARYAEALDRFDRAAALVQAPTMGLMAARSLVKLGRLVEASARYASVTEMPLAPGASDAFKQALTDAAAERKSLTPRIPTLTLTLPPGATATLDGAPFEASQSGHPLSLDPGSHTVVITQGTTTKTERLLLKESESRTLTPTLDSPPPPATTPPLKIAGWTGVALGSAGIVLGAVTGGMAAAAKDDLDSRGCKDNLCPPGLESDVASYNTLRAVSPAGFIAGALLLGAGALTVGLAPSSPKSARIQPLLGPGQAGVKLVF